jgi:hypothetical protein
MSSDDSRTQGGNDHGHGSAPTTNPPQGPRGPHMERTAASRGWPRSDARLATPGGAASPTVGPAVLSGPRYLASYLLALPVMVVALATTGVDQIVSGSIALAWLVLAPTALYSHRAAQILPILSFVFLGLAIVLLSFSSVAFVVDVTATAIMFLVSMPRPKHREGHHVHPGPTPSPTPSTARV